MRNQVIIVSLALAAGAAVGIVALTVELPEQGGPDGPTASAPADAGPPPLARAQWRLYRGDAAMTGVADGRLALPLRLAWRFRTAAPVVSSPVVGDGRVVIGSNDANVYCLDLASGKKRWAYATGDYVEAPPGLIGDAVLVGSDDSFLYCLDANTGELRWRFETGDKILGAANTVPGPGDAGRRVLIGSYDFSLYCLDFATGSKLWEYESDNYINGGVAVSAGRAAFGGCDGLIHVIGSDGNAVRQINAGAYVAATPAFPGGTVCVGNYSGTVFAADANTGRVAWRFESEAPFVSSPAVTPERVVVGSDDYSVYCLDRNTGRKLWTFATRGEVKSSPVVCGGHVVVGSADGRLYVLRLADGERAWAYDLGSPIISSPAVADGLVVIGCDDGSVVCFTDARHGVRQ